MPDRPPNIVLIHSDQHRADCLGVNGHPLLRTPNLDRLAAEGVNYTRAFTPTPICSPERASLLTGRWPSRHGCLSIPGAEIYRPADGGLPLFSRVLRDAGYRLGYVGKVHAELDGSPLDWGFHEFVGLHEYGPWRAAQGLPPLPRVNGWFGETDPHIGADRSRIAWGAAHAVRMIEACRDDARPFFVRWDPAQPHLPNVVPEPYASMYPPETIPPWPSFGDELAGKPYVQGRQRRLWKVDGWSWDRWAPIVGRYLGEISLIDHEVGRLLAALDRLGVADNTAVIYTTDHGDMCGGHGMIDKHFIMYDDVMRVPLIVRFPGGRPAGRTCEAFVLHALDLAATFCALAGAETPEGFAGRCLPETPGAAPAPEREDVFGMWHGGQLGSWTQRMVRNRRWKLVYNFSGEDELYDLETDPAELRNRAADPACKDELARLRRRVAAWMEAIGDPMLNAWIRAELEAV
ncbi:MAG: sulfatase-like hydrolase/transferase [Kiritimatiellae bacterium]|nr:sulfatase-like hydrolase/transferase [Kiritimatiellia bacterium]